MTDFNNYLVDLVRDLANADRDLVYLMVILVAAVIVLDAVSMFARKKRKEAGIGKRVSTISVDGGKTSPVKSYRSDIQSLAGTPDAIIIENGYIIPIERKPLARKIRDRYVAQLLVYMRLIEEFEGKKPPYGYLILGANSRKIKIENSPARQAWLQAIIDEMRAVFDGKPALATPHPRKCAKCDVKEFCSFRHDVVPVPVHGGTTRLTRN